MSNLRDIFRRCVAFIPMAMLVCEDSFASQNSWLAAGFCNYTDTDYNTDATALIRL